MAFTPKGLLDGITAAASEETAKKVKVAYARSVIEKALQEALGELAELQRMLNLQPSEIGPATMEDMATLADNAEEACQTISKAANDVLILR